MARNRKVKGGEEFSALLAGLAGDDAVTVMKEACFKGVAVLADQLRAEIQNLPVQHGYMRVKQKRNVIGGHDKQMLLDRMGISRIDAIGDRASVVVSFSGYNDRPTKKYPKGVPIPMIARSIESGSSIREKNPFVRRAYNTAKSKAEQAAKDAGQKKANELIKKGG